MDTSVFRDNPITFPNLGIWLDPPRVAFHLLGRDVYWYGIILALGGALGVAYMVLRCRRFGLTINDALDCLLWALPLALVFARIYYCVFNWERYADDPITALYFWQGGSSMYGALLGGVLGLVLLGKVRKIPVLALLDMAILAVMIGQIVGRWGNFINREVFGAVTDSFFKMGLHTDAGDVTYFHPLFLYESLWNALGFVGLHLYLTRRKFDGEIFCLYLLWYGLGRFWLDGLRAAIDGPKLFDTGLYVNQVAAALTAVGSLAILLWVYRKRKPTGEKLYVNQIRIPTQEETQ